VNWFRKGDDGRWLWPGFAENGRVLAWILERPPGSVAVLILGTAAAVYGTVLAYSELPRAWRSWSPQ